MMSLMGNVYKLCSDDIEEEIASLLRAQEVTVPETYSDQINKVHNAASGLTWVHILGDWFAIVSQC